MGYSLLSDKTPIVAGQLNSDLSKLRVLLMCSPNQKHRLIAVALLIVLRNGIRDSQRLRSILQTSPRHILSIKGIGKYRYKALREFFI